MKKVYGPQAWYLYLVLAMVLFAAAIPFLGHTPNDMPWPVQVLLFLFAAIIAKVLFFPLFTYDDRGFSSVMIPGVTKPHFHPWSDVKAILPNTLTRGLTGYLLNLGPGRQYIVARPSLSKEDLNTLREIIKLVKGADPKVNVDAGLLEKAGLSARFPGHPEAALAPSTPARVVDSIHYAHHIPLMTGLLVVVNILVFQAELNHGVDPPRRHLTPGNGTIEAMGGNDWDLVVGQGQWWRPITAIFLHADQAHLSGNMVSLFFAGTFLEDYVGRACFFSLFLLGGVGGFLMSMSMHRPDMVCLGASGAILAILAADLVLSFRLPRSGVRAWITYYSLRVLVPGLTPALTIPRNIDLYGHLGGTLTGTLAGLIILAFWRKGEPRPMLEPLFRVTFAAGLGLMVLAGLSQAKAYDHYSFLFGPPPALKDLDQVKDAKALVRWGFQCRDGERGTVPDIHKAFRCFQLAAQMGDAVGQVSLGYLYDTGRGTPRNYAKAFHWYEKAAGQGNADAQNNLGCMYLNGQGTQKDPEEAVRWYRLAVKQGHASAQAHLGYCYQTGQGVGKDPQEALRLYHASADKGNMVGEFYIGQCYEKGELMGKDPAQARAWYKKSADQGYPPAQKRLARLKSDRAA